jgi:protein-disulfide isomerase
MRDIGSILAAALGGAFLAVVIVFAAANTGYLPGGAGGVSDARIRAYLLSHPELVTEMTDRVQAKQDAQTAANAAAAIKKIGLKTFFDPSVAFVTGPENAKTSLVEFYDYDCPYCRASLPAMERFYEKHKNDTRFSFIEFPIPSLHGPGADLAAMVSLAARRQPDKYVPLHFALMSQEGSLDEATIYAVAAKVGLDIAKLKKDVQDPIIAETLVTSKNLAHSAGVDGTPTFIINGVMHPGAVDDDELKRLTKTS